ncbi:hypothetical protein ACFP1Z_08105 [Streptomyces gamaensis]|uniref:Uncharacterized protein n=1 Tax=Streptomyces gamaensis TaxID=1763542 RepID=A0ABW0YXH7_9ACTN
MGRRQPLRPRAGARETHRIPTWRPRGARRAVLAHDRGWAHEARSAWLCGTGLAGLLFAVDLARGSLDWPRGCCWGSLGVLLAAILCPQRITAGDGWLAARGLLRERRVHTDLLTRVRRSDGITPRLVLGDAGGNRVELDPEVLVANPLLWHLLDTGVRRARASGLLREGAAPLAALARRVDDEGARRLLESSGLD